MRTREEIEAAAKRYSDNDYPKRCRGNISAWDEYWQPIQLADDQKLLANAYLAECQQRERDKHPPTREMFERLCTRQPESMGLNYLRWWNSAPCPVWWDGDHDIDLDTVAKLRAACLLLGIETEGIL